MPGVQTAVDLPRAPCMPNVSSHQRHQPLIAGNVRQHELKFNALQCIAMHALGPKGPVRGGMLSWLMLLCLGSLSCCRQVSMCSRLSITWSGIHKPAALGGPVQSHPSIRSQVCCMVCCEAHFPRTDFPQNGRALPLQQALDL